MIKKLLYQNKILFWLGLTHFVLFALLLLYLPLNKIQVLGINSLIKPIKFALSIWLFCWTMAIILSYFNDIAKVKIYSRVAVITLSFEQLAITFQALRGELSHFNKTNIFGRILFSAMGVFILTITIWTGYMTYVFIRQKNYNLKPEIVLSLKIALIYFTIFSLFGGYISSLPGHTVGGIDGGKGLWFLNWSTFFGDLRIAHFFGIHSLQIIPLLAVIITRFSKGNFSKKAIWVFSILYFIYIISVLIQALKGIPFINN